ncbi:MAG: oxygen-independent coproporphyrinogen III oxidase [Verrucomicrobiales bacterium]|jgi:oxygen-independent coproporphyrinogen-3 oxidase|nr:oxygen-independent coproporphyrinogen III oxidase [Verrucomicrobiales bacterium]
MSFKCSQPDFALLSRYNVAGPRYTSYPTAPQFTETFTGEDLLREIADTDGAARPLSLYFHLPFCASVCLYCGCNVTFTTDRSRSAAYLRTLYREMDLLRPRLSADREVAQLHWGGGTPTFFAPRELAELIAGIKERFRFAADAELGVEVDPRVTTAAQLRVLGAAGFNRLSVGVQDFDADVQRAVHRIQSVEQTRAVIAEARGQGMRSVSVDLMYGLPRQSRDSFARTLEQVLALAPDRLALFNFAYLPAMIRRQQAIQAAELPPPAVKLAIFQLAVERLSAAGYEYVGMDHFARADDDLCRAQRAGRLCRNFQGYSTHADCDLLAFGVSAIGSPGRVYAQNHKSLRQYAAAIDRGQLATARGWRLSDDDLLRREVIMRLMCDFALRPLTVGRKFNVDFATYFAESLSALRPLERDGLLTVSDEKITVTPTGRFLIRNIAMCFDAYLQGGANRYSKTV